MYKNDNKISNIIFKALKRKKKIEILGHIREFYVKCGLISQRSKEAKVGGGRREGKKREEERKRKEKKGPTKPNEGGK